MAPAITGKHGQNGAGTYIKEKKKQLTRFLLLF